jgi:hypothetical protein
MDDKYKPCPFCGSKARENWHEGLAGYSIECNTSEHGCHIKTPIFTMREAAIKKWNTRPLEDAQAAKIEELRTDISGYRRTVSAQHDRIKTLEAENAKVKEFLATELANLKDVNFKLSYFEKKIISEE